MPPILQQKVFFKKIDHLNTTLEEISGNLTPKGKINWISISALFVSILALAFTILSSQDSIEKQKETQAYTAWQTFLATAISNPDLANGLERINGYRISYIADSMSRSDLMKDTDTYNKYIKYAWFVGYALGSAEYVFNLKHADAAWNNTLIEALGGHSAILMTKAFDVNSYGREFRAKIIEAEKRRLSADSSHFNN